MKKLFIIVILVFTFSWFFYSWYYYTCKIKWFCDNDINTKEVFINENDLDLDISNIEEDEIDAKKDIESNDLTNNKIEDIWSVEIVNNYWRTGIDVVKEVKEEVKVENIVKEDILDEVDDVNEKVWTWEVIIETDKKEEICKWIIVSPIKLWSSNNLDSEVKLLEEFLNENEWEELELNWIYETEDYEAVKRFQIKYRKDVLDPWEIRNPTWYVYNMTIKKINEVYCLNNN